MKKVEEFLTAIAMTLEGAAPNSRNVRETRDL
jgi:hypothetical protein